MHAAHKVEQGLLLVPAPTTSNAQSSAAVNSSLDALFGTHEPFQRFLEALKTAVAENDKAAIARIVDYPFTTKLGGKNVRIADAGHFVASYDEIVTPKVKAALAKQTYATLFANAQGVMIGAGEIWFSGICGDKDCKQQTVKITAINGHD